MNKGPNHSTVVIEKTLSDEIGNSSTQAELFDEVKVYMDYRFVYLCFLK